MSQKVLLISSLESAADCANSLAQQLGISVDHAEGGKPGLAALRRRHYSVVIIDHSLAEADSADADLLWKHAGLALPLQVNFAISSGSRLVREVRAALARRSQEQSLALRAAVSTMESELRSTVTGLLLQSQLALSDPTLSPKAAEKLKVVHELAVTLRRKLEAPKTNEASFARPVDES